jgi:GTP-binding protein
MQDHTPTPDADAGGPDAEALERGRLLFARPCVFVAGAARIGDLPDATLPEIAFAGRSNVGKSSLINALTGQNALARISRTPGRTQQLNFFRLDDAVTLVDLPGYGYARASKRQIADWTGLMHAYLKGRVTLHRLCVLVDSRHGLKPSDEALMDELDDDAVSYQVVLTKADKPNSAEVAGTREAVARALARRPAAHPDILVTSARTGGGIPELRAALAALAGSIRLS